MHNSGFLLKLFWYYTPKKVIDIIKKEETKFIIKNPPYDEKV